LLVSNPVILGRVSGLYGIKGWVKVFSYTVPRNSILNYKELYLGQEKDWQPVRLSGGRCHGKSIILKFKDFKDRTEAETLIDKDIATKRDNLPELENGHYYWSDLIGLKVIQANGHELGTVKKFIETGTHDVMVVEGSQEILIPFVYKEIIKNVDLVRQFIDVDWDWS
tara:strand:- start:9129 stop:9632 length:504 start_codon:yes stop_codon:yes gene_type:complete